MSATRDKLFDFMNRVIDGEKITLNAETKVISIILGIDYNAFLSKDREYFAHNDFKDEIMHQYERYLDLYKLKGKRFNANDPATNDDNTRCLLSVSSSSKRFPLSL